MSARNKLVAMVGLVIVFLIGISTFISHSELSTYTSDEYRKNLSIKSNLISKTLEQKMDGLFSTLEHFSNSLLIMGDKVFPTDDMVQLLIKYQKETGVENVYIGLENGATYASATKGLIPDFNAIEKKREWFRLGMSGESRAISKPFLSTTGNTVMSLVVPVRHNNNIIAVVGMSLNISDITNYVNSLVSDLHLFVARKDGYLMAAYQPDMIGQNLFDLRPTYKQYATQLHSEHIYSVDGIGEVFAVSSLIKSLGWSVWAWSSFDEIYAISNQTVENNIVVGLIATILAVLLIYYLVTRLMYRPIGGEPAEIASLVDRVAMGDLTETSEDKQNFTGVLGSTISMAAHLRDLVSDLSTSSGQLMNTSDDISNTSSNVDQASQSQIEQLSMVATAMTQMSSTVSEVAQSAQDASLSSTEATQVSKDGIAVVEAMNDEIIELVANLHEVQDVIKSLHSESANVGSILDVIQGIAEQTNLLALNAAIEAARAGEQGRGFAVVADEVRNLASKTQQSTSEIQNMIEALQKKAQQSVSLMDANVESAVETLGKTDAANDSLEAISVKIRVIQDMNHQIATASEEQSAVAAEVTESVNLVNELAISMADDVKSNVNNTQELGNVASRLNDVVSKFHV